MHILARLVDYSLVQVTGEGRYDLHPLIDQFLKERLLACGEFDEVTSAHTAYYSEFLHTQLSDLKSGQQLAALHAIQVDMTNIFSAWQSALIHLDYDNIVKMWETLIIYTEMVEGQQLYNMQESVRDLRLPKVPIHPAQTYLLYIKCLVADNTDNIDDTAQQALQFAEHFQDRRAIAFIFCIIGIRYSYQGDEIKALQELEKSLTLFRELNDEHNVAKVLKELAFSFGVIGKSSERKAAHQERYHIYRRMNDQVGLIFCLHELGAEAFFSGEYTVADAYEQEALTLAQRFGNWIMVVHTTGTLGLLRLVRGDFDDANQIFQRTTEAAETVGGSYPKVFNYLLGLLANLRGEYLQADLYLSDARLIIAFNPFMMMFINWGHAVSKFGLRDFKSSQEYLQAVLRSALSANSTPIMTLSLPLAALLLWQVDNKELAIECMGLWYTHPISQQGWFLRSPLGNNAMDKMKVELGETAFDQAWQTGLARDLITTASELLKILS